MPRGTSLVVQWLRPCASNAGGLGSIPGQGTYSHMLQLTIPQAATKTEILRATTKTRCSQINTFLFFNVSAKTLRRNHGCKSLIRQQSCKILACCSGDTRDVGLVPGSGRSPGVGNGNPLQYPCLENHGPQATVHNFTKSWT